MSEPTPPAPTLEPGDRIGDWVVQHPLGRGGTGRVFACHHVVTERLRAAVKVLELSDVQQQSRLFLREVEALARLQHPGVVAIRSPGIDAKRGMLWLAMELVEGETLRDLLRRGPMTVETARRTFAGITDALAYAHQHGIYHRDIKPTNVMIRPTGEPVLVDFGISVDTQQGDVDPDDAAGTPTYMPPEAFVGVSVDPTRADVYGVGVLLYEALTGRRAFRPGTSGGDITRLAFVGAQKRTTGALDPGEAAEADLRQIVGRATAARPEDMTMTMAELAGALGRGVALPWARRARSEEDDLGTVDPIPPSALEPAEPSMLGGGEDPETQRWLAGAVVAAVALSLFAGALAWWWIRSLG